MARSTFPDAVHESHEKVAKMVSLNWQEYLVTEIAVVVAFAVIVGAPLFAAACSVYRLLCKKKVEENAEVDVHCTKAKCRGRCKNAKCRTLNY